VARRISRASSASSRSGVRFLSSFMIRGPHQQCPRAGRAGSEWRRSRPAFFP
jgi:hypothetical protein